MISVIGCPRSGTLYAYKILVALGLDVGMEQPGRQGTVDWHGVCREVQDDTIILHQVRHPLKTMSSMQTLNYSSWNFIDKSRCVDVATADSLTLQVMRLWYFWNREAERVARFTYRVEDIEESWPIIRELLSIEYMGLPDIPKDTNSRASRYVPLTWRDIEDCAPRLYQNIVRLGIHYGYEDEVHGQIGNKEER